MIIFKNNTASGNGGDGFRFEGIVPTVFEGNTANDNGGVGVNVVSQKVALLERLNLPAGVNRKEIDPVEMGKLLTLLLELPEAARPAVVEQSGVLAKLTKGAFDVVAFVASIVTIASDECAKDLAALLLN